MICCLLYFNINGFYVGVLVQTDHRLNLEDEQTYTMTANCLLISVLESGNDLKQELFIVIAQTQYKLHSTPVVFFF
jgi:hypothetical protein